MVLIGGRDSRFVDVLSGVLQSSVLGPILFLIYVHSLGVGLACKCVAFVGDFKLLVCHPRVRGANELQLQEDLDRVHRISCSWNLKLNFDKCVVIGFGAKLCGSGTVSNLGSVYFLGVSFVWSNLVGI